MQNFCKAEKWNNSKLKGKLCHLTNKAVTVAVIFHRCPPYPVLFSDLTSAAISHLLLFHIITITWHPPNICVFEWMHFHEHTPWFSGYTSLIKGHWQGICQALSPDQHGQNYSCILNTPSGKRASSFVFQVGSTMDVTYLTRSIRASFKDSSGTVGVSTKHCFLSKWFRLMSMTVVAIAVLHYLQLGQDLLLKQHLV